VIILGCITVTWVEVISCVVANLKYCKLRQTIMAACPEYNDRYAQPIEWTWTNPKMRHWFDKHAH
jgi:hypothetical protein